MPEVLSLFDQALDVGDVDTTFVHIRDSEFCDRVRRGGRAGFVARLEPSAPSGPAAFAAAWSGLPATAANLRTASMSSPYAIDQTSIRSARAL